MGEFTVGQPVRPEGTTPPSGEKRGKFYFRGGSLALDFTNTVGDRLHPNHPRDYFQTLADVLEWARVAGILDAATAATSQSRFSLAKVIRIRELIYRIFAAEAQGRAPREEDLQEFGRLLKESRNGRVLHRRRARIGTVYFWAFAGPVAAIDAVLSTILEDVASLLSSPEMLARLRICADETCGWLFLDQSRPGKRRWCSMADCGNRAKARRHYNRQKG